MLRFNRFCFLFFFAGDFNKPTTNKPFKIINSRFKALKSKSDESI